MTVEVACVWPARAVLGEGPLWSPAGQVLWWVDIKGRALCRYRPADGARERWESDTPIGSLALDAAGGLVAATWRGFHRLRLDGDRVRAEALALPPGQPDHVRFNDGEVAPDGAFWAGTMDDREQEALGDWWRLGADGGLARLGGGFRVTNGPAFDARRGRAYLTDSAERVIYACDGWDAGAVENRRPWRTFESADGYPDGMTVDADGRLWVAFWDGGCVRALDPESGEVTAEIAVPARRPTSVAFGGPDLDILFVTSAAIGLDRPADTDGGLFAVAGHGARGRPPVSWGAPGG